MNENVKKALKRIKGVDGLGHWVRCTMTRISPVLASKVIYRISRNRKLDLKNPVDFNEKIMWLKLNTYYKNPLITQCVDKYAVREYVRKKGCGELLNELIGVYESSSQISWDALPRKFVMKCNHGCGYNIICDDKSRFKKEEVFAQLDAWMKEDYYLDHAEVNYKYVPKRIIVEKYLESDDGIVPNDYKIYCFHGEPKYILVCYDREVDLKLLFLDMEWKNAGIGDESFHDDVTINKPKTFEQMIEYSRKLAEGFPFVRMDYYEIGGQVVFGEMTFTPAGGLANYYNEEGLIKLGEMIHLHSEMK